MDSGDPFGERERPEEPKKRGAAVVLLAIALAVGVGYGYVRWDEAKKDERKEREHNEAVCDLLVDSGNVYSDFEDCMRHR